MDRRKIGVLVMSYGTPAGMEEVEAYYTHIRHGRPPTEEQLMALKGKYEAIGGVFPLRKETDKQAEALKQRLSEADMPFSFEVYQGLRHTHPFIEEGIAKMREEGVSEAVGIVLAPHFSQMSIGEYIRRAETEANRLGVRMAFVKRYGLHPRFIELWGELVRRAFTLFTEGENPLLLFSAHSLPARILQSGDPYMDELMATAKAVGEKEKIASWRFVWQSAGQTPEPWLGPDILEVIPALKNEGVKAVLTAPIGFVSEHLEILYDLDLDAKRKAEEVGIHLERTAMPGTDPRFIDTLADEVIKAAYTLI
ncbi:ferrochelatase [Thermicanus aegyptius]|uniref:ferrochelatase n=1 Tax=Thermicanus aegyptius TaxID=94009 RepID=UPI000401F308|nr:ferrochelatase [Thermicanus aegyptius]